jgi:outer membrane protein TolC
MEALRDVVIASAQSGDASGYARDRVTLAATAHRVALQRAESHKAELQARLFAYTGLRVDTLTLGPVDPLPPLEQALQLAIAQDATLEELEHAQLASAKGLRAERRAAAPDLLITGGARWDAMPDGTGRTPGFEVGAVLELPLFDRNQQAIAGARAESAASEAALAAHTADLTARVESSWHRAHQSVAPAQAVDSDSLWAGARAQFLAGEATLDELLMAMDAIEGAHLAYAEGEVLRRSAYLDLACATGTASRSAIDLTLGAQRP